MKQSHRSLGVLCAFVLLSVGHCFAQAISPALPEKFERLRYNNPGLIVDLGVGIWAHPNMLDIDGDGQDDFLVTSSGPQYKGLYLFKRPNTDDPFAPFLAGEKLVGNGTRFRISHVGGNAIVTSSMRQYTDFPSTFFKQRKNIPFKAEFFIGSNSPWLYFDYDGDGVEDLIIAVTDPRENGWLRAQGASRKSHDDAGRWLHGSSRGYIYWVKNHGTHEKPDYQNPLRIMAGDMPLEVEGPPSPCFADFDGDGLVDLICGSFVDSFTFFKNIGTPTTPRYAPGKPLSHQGAIIHMDLCMIQPIPYDWDKDGKMDLIVGEEDGRVAVLINTGNLVDGAPDFMPPRYLQQEADEVKVGVLAIPCVYDWDGDGLTDLLIGESAGHLVFLKNLGGYPPKWAAPQKLEVDGTAIRIMAGPGGSVQGPEERKWGYTNVSVADWNGNGLPDLIVNSIWGKVLWFENIGTRTEPKLAPAKSILVQWPGETPKPAWTWWTPEPGELVTQHRSSVQAIDLNKDGLVDLVALDRDGFLVFFERTRLDNGELALLPPKRIFRVEPGADSVFNHAHQPVRIPADNFGDMIDINEKGQLAFFGWDPETTEGPRGDLIHVSYAYRGDERDAPELTQQGPALRLNGGWGGRSGRRKFTLVDWNGDGKIDLLVNSRNINFFENISTEPGQFIFRDRGPLDGMRLAGHTVGPAIADWNRDGIPDLLAGTEEGFLYYLENPHTEMKATSPSE